MAATVLSDRHSLAAYRDRYGIEARAALGTGPATDTQRRDARRARAAIHQAGRHLA